MKSKIAGFATLLLLAGCGPSFDRGEVTDKNYNPAGCNTTYIPIQVGNSTIMSPQTNCWNESWSIQIRNCETDKCYLDTKEVSREAYDKCNTGDKFPDCFNPPSSPSKES